MVASRWWSVRTVFATHSFQPGPCGTSSAGRRISCYLSSLGYRRSCIAGCRSLPSIFRAVSPNNGMDRPRSNWSEWQCCKIAADSKERAMTDITTHDDRIATIGMDLGTRSFHLIGMDARGRVIMRQQLSRGRLERHMANLQPCLVGVESGAGARHIGRRLSAFGHNVRLILGQYVKPFRKGQKNDYRDAEADDARPSRRAVTSEHGSGWCRSSDPDHRLLSKRSLTPGMVIKRRQIALLRAASASFCEAPRMLPAVII